MDWIGPVYCITGLFGVYLIWRCFFKKVFSLYLFWRLGQSEQRHLCVDIFYVIFNLALTGIRQIKNHAKLTSYTVELDILGLY